MINKKQSNKKLKEKKFKNIKAFLNALNHMSQITILEDFPKISMVEELCRALKFEIPKPFRRGDDDEIEEDPENKCKQVSVEISNEHTQQKGSFTTGPPLVNENAARAFLQRFKTLKAKQLQTDKKDDEDNESKQINQFWQLFVSFLSDDEQVHEEIKKEKQIFSNSVWNVSSIFQLTSNLIKETQFYIKRMW